MLSADLDDLRLPVPAHGACRPADARAAIQKAERTMDHLPIIDLLILALLILIGLAGLFMIAAGGAVYGLGMAVFVVAVVLGLYVIKRHYDRIDSGRR